MNDNGRIGIRVAGFFVFKNLYNEMLLNSYDQNKVLFHETEVT
jgi:hypothetical protein